MNFQTLGLVDSLLEAVKVTGYTTPTPIQAQAIPAILSGQDVMAAAQTGTGKTAGFTLPILQRLGEVKREQKVKSRHVRALVLTPTRELAAQVRASIETYGKNEGLHTAVVFGGVNINPQKQKLAKGADILVATPGRLLDLYQQKSVDFSSLEILVLDEADRMLDMGFIRDIRRILPLLPKVRQNLMFSATFSNDIRQLARGLCQKPLEIDVAPRNTTVESIDQCVYPVPKEDKCSLLIHLLRQTSEQVLVFSRTKHGANKLVKRLEKGGVRATAIHGNKSQAQRTKALKDFKQDKVQVLVATDIAARGIDIQALSLVINFDLPNVAEDYVHRIGRTGRAGASGRAISLVSPDEKKFLRDIERFIQRSVEREELPEFERGEVNVVHDELQERRAEQRPRRDQKSGNRNRRSGADAGKQGAGRNARQKSQQSPQQWRNAPAGEEGGQGGQRKPRRSGRPGPRNNEAQGRQHKARTQDGQGNSSFERSAQERKSQRDEYSRKRSAGSQGSSSRSRGRGRQAEGQASGSTVSRIRRFFGGNAKSGARAG